MKRVCVLLNKDLSHQTRLLRENEALASAGYEVTVICAAEAPGKPKIEKLEQFEIRRLMRKRLFKYHLFSIRLLKVFFQIATTQPRADFIFMHDPSTLLLGWLLARLWGAKLVYDSHEYWDALFDEEKERLLNNGKLSSGDRQKKLRQLEWTRNFESWALSRCDAVIAVNDSIGELLQKKAKPPIRKYLTLRNFAQFCRVEKSRLLHEHFQLPPHKKIVLYQGQIAEKRGLGKAVDAMEFMTNPDIVLVFIGPLLPADEAFLESLLARIEASDQLRGRIFYKGFLPPSELLQWTASADVGLQPILNCNMNHYLCLPNKIFEYIQAGLPIAASHFPELKNIVEKHQIGFVFDSDNPQEMAESIEQYFAQPEREALYQNNLKLVKHELSWEAEREKLISLFNHL